MDDFSFDLFGNLKNIENDIYSMPIDPMFIQPTDHNENAGKEATMENLSATAVSSDALCANRRVLEKAFTATDETPMVTVGENDTNNFFDAENPAVSIKIRWKGNYEKYLLRKHQKFSHIMEQIAERENVPLEEVILNLDNKFINPNDTPSSIDYKIYHFIDGRALKLGNVSNQIATNINKQKTKGFHLKVQSGHMKRPLVIELKKTEPLKTLFAKSAEQLNVQISQLKLYFDGEPLTMSETPEKLGLDCGEIIDMFIK